MQLGRLVDPMSQAELWKDPVGNRKARAAHRHRVHRAAAAPHKFSRKIDLSFLELNTVRRATANQYTKHLEDFKTWLRQAQVKADTPNVLDLLLMEYMEHLYFLGYNHSQGDSLLAALRYHDDCLNNRTLPRVHRSMLGFRRLAPGTSRAPLPYVAVLAMAGCAMASGCKEFATMLLVQFCGYLRPSELVTLTACQVIAPVLGSQTAHWALLLAPQEEKRSSKTNAFDESVLLDWSDLPALGRGLARFRRGKSGRTPLWTLSQPDYTKQFVRFAEMSGVSCLAPHPYAVRHGGASFDALHKRRTLGEIRLRGRWRTDSSVARYNKHARVLKEVERLPLNVRRYGSSIGKYLNEYLDGVRPVPGFSILQRGLLERKRAGARRA